MPSPPSPTLTDPDLTPDRVYYAVAAGFSIVGAPLLRTPAVRVAVFAFVVAGAALHAATHTRALKRSPRLRVGTAIVFRLALAATAQTAVAGGVRIPVPVPSSMAGFLARRTLPPLFFVSAATLRTGSALTYAAAVLAELAIYAAMQPAACAGMLADAPGGIYFFAAIARRVHEAALRVVTGGGAGAGAGLMCPAHACRVALFFFFGSAGVLGAAASRCGGTRRRAAPAAVATGIYAAAVAAVALSRLAACPPLPPHQAALLAAGPPPGGEVAVWERVAEKARLVASDVAAVAAWAARAV